MTSYMADNQYKMLTQWSTTVVTWKHYFLLSADNGKFWAEKNMVKANLFAIFINQNALVFY